jgi:hypothetical protein
VEGLVANWDWAAVTTRSTTPLYNIYLELAQAVEKGCLKIGRLNSDGRDLGKMGEMSIDVLVSLRDQALDADA